MDTPSTSFLLHASLQAFLAGLAPWAAITLGAGAVFLQREFSRKTLEIMLGAAGGMMLGATFFALLMPSIELSAPLGAWDFAPPAVGLFIGAIFLRIFDSFLPHMHNFSHTKEGLQTAWQRSILLVTAMALHHIPEGLAVGVSYGAVELMHSAGQGSSTALTSHDALLLTASIMLQGIPEGLVVSMALRAEGLSAKKSFIFGSISGSTTPIGAAIGAAAASTATQILPIALAFAAGAMLYIIVEDLIPESQASGHGNDATLAVIGGLIIIMTFTTIFS